MTKHELMIIADYTQESSLTLQEFCETCHISKDILNDLITYEIIHAPQQPQDEWMINLSELQRAKIALRLQHDLEVNLSGVALVLDLLDEIKKLREHTKILEKHFVQK